MSLFRDLVLAPELRLSTLEIADLNSINRKFILNFSSGFRKENRLWKFLCLNIRICDVFGFYLKHHKQLAEICSMSCSTSMSNLKAPTKLIGTSHHRTLSRDTQRPIKYIHEWRKRLIKYWQNTKSNVCWLTLQAATTAKAHKPRWGNRKYF